MLPIYRAHALPTKRSLYELSRLRLIRYRTLLCDCNQYVMYPSERDGEKVALVRRGNHSLQSWQRSKRFAPEYSSRRSFTTVGSENNTPDVEIHTKKERRKRTSTSPYYDNNATHVNTSDSTAQKPTSFAASTNAYYTPKTSAGEEFASFDDYLKQSSLSPWVPTPDSVCRRMLQLAQTSPTDVHYDLGCGDGRVNAMALQHFGVKRTVGIDNDAELLRMARDRFQKIGYSCRFFNYLNPTKDELNGQPFPATGGSLLLTNVDLVYADLMQLLEPTAECEKDAKTPFHKKDKEKCNFANFSDCTVMTMFFVEDALNKLKPVLERRFGGSGSRIVTNGYAIPGWEPDWVEVVLDLKIHLYVMSTERRF